MPDLNTVLTIILLIFVVVMLFNIIIFVHELGHFLAGKWRGLQIDRFQIWFGKPIWKKEINGVQYGLGWIPAGGFVALPQMAPMESIEGGNTTGKPLPKISPLDKIIVAIAGPLFSILLALLAAVVVWGVGKPKDFVPSTTVGYVAEGMPGEKAGILPGDLILEINGEEVNGFAGSLQSITERIVLSSGDKIVFKVQRPGVDEPLTLTSGFDTPDSKWFQRSGLRQVGLAPAGPATIGKVYKNSPASKAGLEAGDVIVSVDGVDLFSDIQFAQYLEKKDYKTVNLGVKKASGEIVEMELTPEAPLKPEGTTPKIGVLWDQTGDVDVRIVHPNPFSQVFDSLHMMWVTITSVADPNSDIGVDHLSGPVGIGQMLYQLLLTDDGWRRILGFMVLFNVNLAVLNMLPFPVLDGGHITLAILEKIAGKPVQAKALEIIQTACALALISLMLYVTSKDIGDKLGRGGGGGKEQEEIIFSAE
ncbi:MAG: RIP metalloprotease RseP [Verrucomicrobia bacterium]|jgi:regulator of sigma E protease|nr:RIP metalloprotease RseP [Verrucomicrobiota bacterium]|tara:strand:- start:13191 stop:14618 length:1428 start_codon:yes stop_codon:yes gene_type:complete